MKHSLTVVVESLPYAHRLHGYAGRCSQIHGHNARIEVEVSAAGLDAQGFVADFYAVRMVITRVLRRFDHSLVLCAGDPLCGVLTAAGEHHEAIPAPPSAEVLARLVMEGVAAEFAREHHPSRALTVERVAWTEEPGFTAEVAA